ncbi:hypothetical protein DE146DRAFT_660730 [Phaeosphaeria sp. MPI-PUGE-AT-0046c]|nr:hypothetical protein DE146DRAFT_660730 [Phaeosphaeria sp. MPI-PUGE-AT-0046c]
MDAWNLVSSSLTMTSILWVSFTTKTISTSWSNKLDFLQRLPARVTTYVTPSIVRCAPIPNWSVGTCTLEC